MKTVDYSASRRLLVRGPLVCQVGRLFFAFATLLPCNLAAVVQCAARMTANIKIIATAL